jgi:DNA-binding HxlR family transcriptional regulator
LRFGALDRYQLAADLPGMSPYTIGGHLSDLKRDRLVKMRYDPDRVAWELTDRGMQTALAAGQLELGGAV